MSTRHSDEEPFAYDAADELLDKLLMNVDADLDAAISKIIDLDAGLATAVGSDQAIPTSGSERSIAVNASVPKTFELLRSRWWAALALVGGVLAGTVKGLAVFVVYIRRFSRHDLSLGSIVGAGNSDIPYRESLAEARRRIDVLMGSLGGIYGLANTSTQQYTVQACVSRLAVFRRTLEDGEISRDEAKETIADIQLTFRKAFKHRRTATTPGISVCVVTLVAFSLALKLNELVQWRLVALISCVLLFVLSGSVFVFADSLWHKLEKRERAQFAKIDNEFSGLRRVVHRLFDDADDLDFDRTGLPH